MLSIYSSFNRRLYAISAASGERGWFRTSEVLERTKNCSTAGAASRKLRYIVRSASETYFIDVNNNIPAPALCPARVTRPGSPPNPAMKIFTHKSAVC